MRESAFAVLVGMSRALYVIPVVIVVFAVAWLGLRQYRRQTECRQRNAAFEMRIDGIRQDARKQLKVGTKRGDVARFFTQHEIPFAVVSLKDGESWETGTLYTIGGCAPLGCGTDDALIGLRVKIDSDGAVKGEPEVVSLYTNCL